MKLIRKLINKFIYHVIKVYEGVFHHGKHLVAYEINQNLYFLNHYQDLSASYKSINSITLSGPNISFKIPARVFKIAKDKYVVEFNANDINDKSIQKDIINDIDKTKYKAIDGDFWPIDKYKITGGVITISQCESKE